MVVKVLPYRPYILPFLHTCRGTFTYLPMHKHKHRLINQDVLCVLDSKQHAHGLYYDHLTQENNNTQEYKLYIIGSLHWANVNVSGRKQ